MQPYMPAVTNEDAERCAKDVLRRVSTQQILNLMSSLNSGSFMGDRIEGDFFAQIASTSSCSGVDLREKLFYDLLSSIDRFCMSLTAGHTPENSPRVRSLFSWCLQVLTEEMKKDDIVGIVEGVRHSSPNQLTPGQ